MLFICCYVIHLFYICFHCLKYPLEFCVVSSFRVCCPLCGHCAYGDTSKLHRVKSGELRGSDGKVSWLNFRPRTHGLAHMTEQYCNDREFSILANLVALSSSSCNPWVKIVCTDLVSSRVINQTVIRQLEDTWDRTS